MAPNDQLIDIISEYEAISPVDLDRVVTLHREQGGSLAELLVQESLIDEEDLFFLMSRRLAVPAIPEERLLHLKLSPEIRRRVPPTLAHECLLVPLDLDERAGRLSVAMYDPTDHTILARLQRTARVAEIRAYLARRSAILEVIDGAYGEVEEVAPEDLEELPWLGQIDAPDESPKHLDPSAEDPKVELDPALQAELAHYSEDKESSYEPPRRDLLTDEMAPIGMQPIEPAEPPEPHEVAPHVPLARPVEVHGHSLLRDDPTEQRVLRGDELEQGSYGRHDTDRNIMTPGLDVRGRDIDTDPFPLIDEGFGDDSFDGVNELGPMEGLEDLTGPEREVSEASKPIPVVRDVDMEQEITQVVVTQDLIEEEDGEPLLTPLPDVERMEDLDALLRELLPSVGVLVSMLEERIDPAGGSYREYGRLSRLVARELGLDELAVSRVALAAHLFSLDLALRREVGTDELWDVEVVFSGRPPAPGGLGPSLRSLGAKALALEEDQDEEPVEVRLIRLVVDYLELRAESGHQGASDLETLAQLLRTGGADPVLVDALVRAMEATETPPLLGAESDGPA
jgi:hypothetical protein